ncbi:baseplate J/gp47 family protein [Martelella endophytica]|uniref:Baseplate J family protein n=1 Tax=Martelella endophytica TaxID=1486262 RepID=A0A0D5LQU0_MAREN|nr:baseplate J/gp47 family protein [Martelella endophytica]AJY46476.1 Baseplate J family protein [Martelella endophytica]
MSWPVPSAKTIAARMAATLEAGLAGVLDAKAISYTPKAISFAVRSSRGLLAWILRSVSLELRSIHSHVAWWGRQYFVDTAEDEFVLRHASIWGVKQRGATYAVGSVAITGEPGTVLPADLQMTSSEGRVFALDVETTIGADGTVTAPATAAAAGTAGNYEAGIQLSTVEPWPEIDTITIAVAFSGGADEMPVAELQSATIAHIRKPPQGGAGYDYSDWLDDKFAIKAVRIIPDVVGRGSVGVVVAMKDEDGIGRAPSDDERAAMLAHLGRPLTPEGVRPVTAYVSVHAAEIVAVPLTVRIRPDTPVVRAAIEEAFGRFIATLGDDDDTGNDTPIGATIEVSRLSEEISAANGEYAHDLIVPAETYTLGAYQFPVTGAISFAEAE